MHACTSNWQLQCYMKNYELIYRQPLKNTNYICICICMLLKNTNSLYELVNNLSYYSYLTLFIQYKLDPATLREATLVRIEKVFADPTGKVDSFNAELLVLCKCRVKDVVTSDPFPRASRLPDLAPLWRIHSFDPIRNSTCMSNEDIKIENISRPDTIALLTALGGGDVTRATGHLVIACNFKDDFGVGLEAALARVGKVSEGGPPLICSLHMLGRIRCAEVTPEGPFPQVLMEEVPVWKIHNLATSTLTEHKITNIRLAGTVGVPWSW